jgi:predicted small secreted protein
MSLRRTLFTAFIVATATVLYAAFLTSGHGEPVSGKPLLIGALVVVPLAVAAKNEIDGAGAFALAFVTYFAIAFAVMWLVFRKKSVPRNGK